jgi:L-fuculose-phosphate aldolase
METLEHTASIVWKAIQLGNMNVLPEYERERLMELRNNFNLPGRVASCDATPMPSSEYPSSGQATAKAMPEGVSEQTIRDITERIMAKLAKK